MRTIRVAAVAALAAGGAATMGPLVPDTTGISGCVVNPGDSNAVCTDAGAMADAAACSAAATSSGETAAPARTGGERSAVDDRGN